MNEPTEYSKVAELLQTDPAFLRYHLERSDGVNYCGSVGVDKLVATYCAYRASR